MEPWQNIVAEYDRKAHRNTGIIILTFIGSFRAMNSRVPAERVIQFSVAQKGSQDREVAVAGSHLETMVMAEQTLHHLLPNARALDERIMKRRQQRPHERRYLYDD